MSDFTQGKPYSFSGSFSKTEDAEYSSSNHQFTITTQSILVVSANDGLLRIKLVGNALPTSIAVPAGVYFFPFKTETVFIQTTVDQVIGLVG